VIACENKGNIIKYEIYVSYYHMKNDKNTSWGAHMKRVIFGPKADGKAIEIEKEIVNVISLIGMVLCFFGGIMSIALCQGFFRRHL
jgi:hypothetical protein